MSSHDAAGFVIWEFHAFKKKEKIAGSRISMYSIIIVQFNWYLVWSSCFESLLEKGEKCGEKKYLLCKLCMPIKKLWRHYC